MKNQRALTLIELLITLAVFIVLVTFAMPSMTNYSQGNRVTAETNSIVGALNFARSEAVKRSTNITICKSNDGSTCGGNWNNGWIIFINTDNDSPAVVDIGEDVLSIYGAIAPTSTLQVSAALSNFITYRATGFSNVQGTFIFCDRRGASSARAITINRTGRPSTSKGGGTCTPA